MEAASGAPGLREIGGPSAFGGGWRRFWRLTWVISVTEFKLGYLGTFLGYLWSLVRPLLLFGILYLVFTNIFRFGDQIEHYPILLLFNIMLFTFFADAAERAVTSVVNQENVVRKMQFPRLVIPLSVVLTSAFNMSLNLVAVLVFMLAFGVDPMWTWLLLPVLLIALTMLTTAVAMLLSATYVRFRDIAIIWGVLSVALMYGSPILYGIEIAPADYQTVINANPLAVILEYGRIWMIDPDAPGPADVADSNLELLIPVAITAILCLMAVRIFNREAGRIAEEL